MNKVPTLLDVHSEAILLDQPHLPGCNIDRKVQLTSASVRPMETFAATLLGTWSRLYF